MPARTLLVAAAAALAASAAHAQTVPANYSTSTLASGIPRPTAMAVAPNGDVYICQQEGTLRIWVSGSGLSDVATFEVDDEGERGLLGIALDPSFASNRFVYLYYTATTPMVHNRLARITLNAAGNAMVGGTEVTLLDLNNLGATNHNGGAIHFGPDGRLYVAVGENANGNNSQSIGNLLGKILRVNTTPGNVIPDDNPTSFPGIAGTPSGNNRAIWAVGLRNPFTFAFQPGTGRMFINDVGQNTWEEINDGIAGRNYGWDDTEGFFNQPAFPNFTNPLVAYHHSNGALNQPSGIGNFTGNVIAGGVFYTPASGNANFPFSYANDYFFSDGGAGIIRTFDPATGTGGGFGTNFFGNVDFALAPNNTMLTLRGAGGTSGSLIRITYNLANGACCAPDGTCSSVNGINCGAGSTFIWGGVCSPNPCPQPTPGACCLGGSCSISTAAACAGIFQGAGTSCTPNPCAQAMGACCRGSTCTNSLAVDCTGPNTRFALGVCNAPGNNTTPCCRADFNQSGAVSVQDLFDFLAAYFFGSLTADINGSGGLSVQDLFDFLAAYFAGCV